MRRRAAVLLLFVAGASAWAGPSEPVRARRGMVVSQSARASEVGAQALADGGSAVDAAVATAFALAVTHPSAGNIGGGGFLLLRTKDGSAHAYDFREKAPAAAHAKMFLNADGSYNEDRHHDSHLAVGVPGTVAGLHLAWKEHGKLPWRRLLEPAIALARDGFVVSDGLARSLQRDPHGLPQVPGFPRPVLEGGDALRGGRPLQAARPGPNPRAHRRLGARGLLRRRDRGPHREGDEGGRRDHHRARPRGLPGAEARSRARQLPRLRGDLDVRPRAPEGPSSC